VILLKLFYEFFLIGLFSVGGGLATLPFLQDLGERTGWFTAERLADMLAISESTPGPMGVNMATYTGVETAGAIGGIVATLGLITPSIIIILIIARILKKFQENAYVKAAFDGIRPASTALISVACISIILIAFKIPSDIFTSFDVSSVLNMRNLIGVILAGTVFVMSKKTKLHPIIYIAAGAAAGIIFKL